MTELYSKHSGVSLLLLFNSLTPFNGQTGFWCLHKSCRELYPWHSGTGKYHLDHNNISNLQSITIVLYYKDKMTSLSSWSISFKIQALLANDFPMKDVDLSLIFPQPLTWSQMNFCSSSNLQITTHISSIPSRPMSATSSSNLSMIQVVLDHDLCMKV